MGKSPCVVPVDNNSISVALRLLLAIACSIAFTANSALECVLSCFLFNAKYRCRIPFCLRILDFTELFLPLILPKYASIY